jgi:pyruvate/2-oxoglutarate dehydrogenase complex dihydrolipoamide acyltransferase (E2) component
MSVTLRVPKLAVSMQNGILQQWLVPDGAVVSEGEPIYTIEAEKTVADIQAPAAGVLRQKAAIGQTYPVGTELGEIADAPAAATSTTPASAAALTSGIGALGPVFRWGYVVDDVHAAAAQWSALLGAGPFFVAESFEFTQAQFRGAAGGPRLRTALGFAGEQCIQLVQQLDDRASPFSERGPGLHHVSIFSDDPGAAARRLADAGYSTLFRGQYAFGGESVFLDTRAQLGVALELLSRTALLTGMINRVKAAHVNWDRQELIRKL